ncbi:MAG: diguanylate cyclase, partial [Campylobacterales bacterium]|nr:diguanylate cyclase [Campylobacterales bacterium]
LVIDDSKSVNLALSSFIEEACHLKVLSGFSLADCEKIIEQHQEDIVLAIVDLNLPDCEEGDAAVYTVKYNIPTIVLTGNYSDEIRDSIYRKKVSDYFLKENANSFELVVQGITRMLKNRQTKVLVCDNTKVYRRTIVDILKRQMFDPIVVDNGIDALKKLKEHPEINIVVTDYNLPLMDGLELTREIRKTYKKDEFGIVVTSDNDGKNIPAKFLKFGANDFVKKPFSQEELTSRINSNLEILDLFQESKDRANKDFMTGMFNRRYFFDEGSAKFVEARHKKEDLCVAMFDIDKFKSINDTYGHDVGDEAIKEVGKILERNLQELNPVISRFGGEEFCVILFGQQKQKALDFFETIRKDFESNTLQVGSVSLKYTISIGVFFPDDTTLEEAVKGADQCLYKAKETGRNKVVSNIG